MTASIPPGHREQREACCVYVCVCILQLEKTHLPAAGISASQSLIMLDARIDFLPHPVSFRQIHQRKFLMSYIL
jgi:hypothetical protein